MNRVAASVLSSVALLLALPVLLEAAPITPSQATPSQATMGRVPAERRARIQELMPRLDDPSAAALRAALSDFDQHSSFWQSLKWATNAGGAVLTPIFASVGIVGTGKILSLTALETMKWGGPIMWGIGATVGLGGYAALMYHQHTRFWYPRALERLDAAIEAAAQAARPAASQPNQPVTAALAPRANPGQPMGLLGVNAAH